MFDKSKFESVEADGVVTLTYTDPDVYKNSTEIPFKTLKEVEKYREAFALAATDTAVEEATKILESNQDANKVQVVYPFTTSARGNITVDIDRSKEIRIPATGEKEHMSSIKVIVKDPYVKVSKSHIRELSAGLTEKFIKAGK